MLTVDGLATGLDTGRIIEGMLEIQQAQVDRFNTRKQEIVEQQTAFRSVEARLLELQSSITGLRRFTDNVFQRRQATVSDESVAVSVSNLATPGVYDIRVTSLAQSHQIASDSFSAENAQIANGTLTFQVGDGPSAEIVIDDRNNTIESLAASINTTRNGISAAVINDGDSFRLLMTAGQTGAEQQISIKFAPADAQNVTPFPTFDLENPVQAASDATIVLGSGSGALTYTSPTNQVDEMLPGVTMNLLQSDPAKTITISIARNTEPAREAITEFVNAYNGVLEFIDEQQQFDPQSGVASLLFGNRSLLSIRDSLAREITSIVPGLGREMNRLTAAGIRVDARGRLTLRSSVLDDVLNERIENVTLDDVQRLFGVFGETNSPQIRFIFAAPTTKTSTSVDDNGITTVTPYQVEVLQAAEQAHVSAASSTAASTTIDETNDQLVISVDGQLSDTLALTHGVYTPHELAEQLETTINADEKLAGRDVTVTVQDNQLEITSIAYGRSSQLEIVSGSALAALGFAGGETDKGQDVVGRYLVNKDGEQVGESATGQGQILTGSEEGGATHGLQLRVSLSQNQIGRSAISDVTVTRGIAADLDDTLESMLNFGQLLRINESLNEQIDSIDLSIDHLSSRFEAQQRSLIEQFAQLETTVSQLQSAGGFLAAQLASLPSIGL